MTGMWLRAAVLRGGAVLLWVTDFVHHIPAAVIGMGVVLVVGFSFGYFRGRDLIRLGLE